MSSLRELGELRIIDILERALGTSSRTVVGFGDDISAVTLSGENVAVLKTDMLVGSTDVPPGMTMRQAARKAVVANVSDLAAKGVRPFAGIVALGLPPHLTKQNVLEIASGLRDGAKEYGFPLVGGDTNESKDLTITIALYGIAGRKRLVLRSGARVGDVVAVTGEFGATTAGLKALLEKKKSLKELAKPLYEAVFNPRAQLDLGVKLVASGELTASTDSSDGLAWSLHELCEASRVGMRLDNIPVSEAAETFAADYGYSANDLALYGGEEYHLVVTIRRGRFKFARRAARGRLLPIGVVTPRSTGISFRGAEIARKGWEHFRRW